MAQSAYYTLPNEPVYYYYTVPENTPLQYYYTQPVPQNPLYQWTPPPQEPIVTVEQPQKKKKKDFWDSCTLL